MTRRRGSSSALPPALLICCKDYRFIQPIQRFVKNRLGIRFYDLKATAGGLRAMMDSPPVVRQWIWNDIELVYRLHGVRRIILVQHEDCAAYGGSKAFKDLHQERAFQQRRLGAAKRHVARSLKGVRVETFFASKHGSTVRLLRVRAT